MALSLDQKVQAFLSSPAGQQKIRAAIEADVQREVMNLENAVVQEQGELPFSFGVSNDSITYTSVGGSVRAECVINFNHEDATRKAFWSGGKWPSGNLIYLFNNGFSFASQNPPVGTWHGRKTVAMTSRSGKHFVQSAVNNYLAGAPSGVEVEIDGAYT